MAGMNKTQSRWIVIAIALIGVYVLYVVLKWVIVAVGLLLAAGLLLWWLRGRKPS